MSDLYTNGDAIDLIENEGLDYAVRHYTSGSSFKDSDTGLLWDEAANALNNLVNHLERETGREVDG